MPNLQTIDRLAEHYAKDRAELAACVQRLQDALTAVKRLHLQRIRTAAARASTSYGELHTAVTDSADEFQKPRTRLLHGVKVGFTKNKGRLVWDDDAQVIKRIRELFIDEVGVLVNVKESPNRDALQKLTAAELKRLGVRIAGAGDQVVITLPGSEVDKFVDALFTETADAAEAAA